MPLFENNSNSNNNNNGMMRSVNTRRKNKSNNSNSNNKSKRMNTYRKLRNTRKRNAFRKRINNRQNVTIRNRVNNNVNSSSSSSSSNNIKFNALSNNNSNTNNNNSNSNTNNNNKKTCSICLGKLDTKSSKKGGVVKIECDHVFHKSCICKSYKQTNNKCPLCKQPYTMVCDGEVGLITLNNEYKYTGTTLNNNIERYGRNSRTKRNNSFFS
jgi:hypothetical protein